MRNSGRERFLRDGFVGRVAQQSQRRNRVAANETRYVFRANQPAVFLLVRAVDGALAIGCKVDFDGRPRGQR